MKDNRIGEIDFLRALAIILMVAFHLGYDLENFYQFNIHFDHLIWFTIGKVSALLFIVVSAISSGFSKNTVSRGLKVFGYGMGISLVTYFTNGDQYIRFGILHFLGLSMLLFPLLKRLGKWQLLIFAIASLAIGIWFGDITIDTGLFLPLGLMYKGFSTIDYYPLFPYIGASAIGVLAYKYYYQKGSHLLPNTLFKSKWIYTLSKHSLGIYIVHQPVLLFILFSLHWAFSF